MRLLTARPYRKPAKASEYPKKRRNILQLCCKTAYKILKTFIIICSISIFAVFLYVAFPPTKVDKKIANYEKYLSQNLGEYEYTKIGINEAIFPANIGSEMAVGDYVVAWHKPRLFDGARWLMCLEVKYDKEAYQTEVERLTSNFRIDDINTYGITGFKEPYSVLALETIGKNGLIYALTDGKESIIYIEMISYDGSVYGNTFYSLRIPNQYLPNGY